eukprot:8386459-Pyramimonas_sp.AAC.1
MIVVVVAADVVVGVVVGGGGDGGCCSGKQESSNRGFAPWGRRRGLALGRQRKVPHGAGEGVGIPGAFPK